MSVSGLTGSITGCLLNFGGARDPRSGRSRGLAFCLLGRSKGNVELLNLKRNGGGVSYRRDVQSTHLVKCAMDASYGDMAGNHYEVFPRIHVKDPYKRLGISREASEEEIQAARNFLIQKYAGHKPSIDAIESAHDKIIMQKFYERRNPKIDIKKKVREVRQSRFIQAFSNRFQRPSTKVIIQTSAAFLVLGVLTVLFPTEDGPTLQVLLSLVATVYFIYNRLRSKFRALFYGFVSFFLSWLIGTFLMVSAIPPIIRGLRAFEVTTSLITYVLLWVFSTYLK